MAHLYPQVGKNLPKYIAMVKRWKGLPQRDILTYMPKIGQKDIRDDDIVMIHDRNESADAIMIEEEKVIDHAMETINQIIVANIGPIQKAIGHQPINDDVRDVMSQAAGKDQHRINRIRRVLRSDMKRNMPFEPDLIHTDRKRKAKDDNEIVWKQLILDFFKPRKPPDPIPGPIIRSSLRPPGGGKVPEI